MPLELPPIDTPVVSPEQGARTQWRVTQHWNQWFTRLFNIANAVATSGVTANRPTVDLFIGMSYFDTTLGKMTWLQSVRPDVWVDSNGEPAVAVQMPHFHTDKNGVTQADLGTALEKVTWSNAGGEFSDVGGYFDFTNNRYLPLIAGEYAFIVDIFFTGAVSANDDLLVVIKRGTTIIRGVDVQVPPAALHMSVPLEALIDLNGTTDFVEVFAANETDGTRGDIDGDVIFTNFSGFRVGPS